MLMCTGGWHAVFAASHLDIVHSMAGTIQTDCIVGEHLPQRPGLHQDSHAPWVQLCFYGNM